MNSETLMNSEPIEQPTTASSELNALPPPTISVLTASRMWQSKYWTKHTSNVLSADEINKIVPLPSVRSITWRLFKQRREYDVVSTAGDVNFWYALFNRFGFGPKAAHVAQELFLPEPQPGWKWKLKRLIRRIVFSDVDTFIVYSRGEQKLWAEYLSLPVDRFQTLIFHTNVLQPEITQRKAYGFAAGRSERDYATFFEAVRNIDYQFVVVSDSVSVEGLEVPANVELHCNITYEKYLEFGREAAFTVVPLKVRKRSSGQVVILEGYGFGKPTVCTRMVGTVDYVVEGETGLMCQPESALAMREAIQKMIDSPELVETMGENAINEVRKKYTFDVFVNNLFELMTRTVEKRKS
jgi:glycosyltransferase involved in cell wall biosynthesis